MQNEKEKYIEEMNRLTFSEDLEERIMSNIFEQKRRRKRKYIAGAILAISVLMGIKLINVSIDVLADADSSIDDVEISPDRMVISNIQDTQDEAEVFYPADGLSTFSDKTYTVRDDLIFYDYGENALQVEENSKIIINLSWLCSVYDIEHVYLYNCITCQTIEIPFSEMIEYESEQSGVYIIKALTAEREIIELSKYVTIEISIKESN